MNNETEKPTPVKKNDPQLDLAVERTELALERTHLAWVRTMFTLMTAGLAIDKAAAYIHDQLVLQNKAFTKNAHGVGIFLTSFGTILLVIEAIQFIRRRKQLSAMKMAKNTYFSTPTILVSLVIMLGIVLTILMITTG